MQGLFEGTSVSSHARCASYLIETRRPRTLTSSVIDGQGLHYRSLNAVTLARERWQVQAALAEVEGYHAVEGSLQSKQLLGEARGNLSKMNHISHIRCGTCLQGPLQGQGVEQGHGKCRGQGRLCRVKGRGRVRVRWCSRGTARKV